MGVPDASEGPLQRRGRPVGGLPRRDGRGLDPPRDPRRAGHQPVALAHRPVWRVVQSATFADAPAEARRLIRRRQRGARGDEAGRRAVRLHDQPHGQAAPRGRAPGPSRARSARCSGSLEAIEAKKTLAGKDFGELVRERRRQFGLPLPIADKVLPFRPGATPEATSDELPAHRR